MELDALLMVEEQDSKIKKSIASYGKDLMRFIRKRVKTDADAEDILQDVWYQLSAVVNARPIEQIGAWLYRVARNRITDKYRKKTELALDDEADEDAFSLPMSRLVADQTPETIFLRNLFWEDLLHALEELPEEQRQVFVWHELENKSFQEIALLTNEPEGRLISRKYYAVQHLRKRLRNWYEEWI